ncbi:MAG: hypothetical protein K0S39_5207 [Paenibacillus sp.]|nr:hypothetical protein [Paenibacillus sp.]
MVCPICKANSASMFRCFLYGPLFVPLSVPLSDPLFVPLFVPLFILLFIPLSVPTFVPLSVPLPFILHRLTLILHSRNFTFPLLSLSSPASERKQECGFRLIARKRYITIIFGHNLFTYSKTESGTVLFIRYKRCKDRSRHFRRNARSVIAYSNVGVSAVFITPLFKRLDNTC